MPFRIARQAQPPVAHDEVPVARRDDDAAGGGDDRHSVRGIGHAAAGLPVEPIGERGPERLIDVKDEQDRELEMPRAGRAGSRRPRPGPPVDAPMATSSILRAVLCGSVRGRCQRGARKVPPAARADG